MIDDRDSPRIGDASIRPQAAMRIHLTGAGGFVGRRLVPALRDARHLVTPSDIAATDGGLDLLDRAAVYDAFARDRPELVIHAGAISGPMLARGDPARMFDVNVSGTLAVVEAMRRLGIRRLVHFSSNAVYQSRADRAPVPESAALGNVEPYGASKIAAEAVVAAYAAEAGIDAWMLRISSIYGPGRVSPCFIGQAIAAGRSGGTIEATDERTNMRQFVHVADVVAAVLAAVARPAGGCVPVNITAGEYLPEETIARVIKRHLPGLAIRIVATKPPGDGTHGPLDLARAEEKLGYHPSVGIEAGIAGLIGESAVQGRL